MSQQSQNLKGWILLFIKNTVNFQKFNMKLLQAKDKQIYEYIFERSQVNLLTVKTQYIHRYSLAYLLLNMIFKFILIMHFEIENFLQGFDQNLAIQLTLILVTFDFWITKNICGRGLAGLKWFFADDPNGNETFMYQARVNPEYVHPMYKRSFWFIQISYVLIGFTDINVIIGEEYNIQNISITLIIVAIIKNMAAIANLFLFYKAYVNAQVKRNEFQEQYGLQFIEKLGPCSFVVYF